jgi:hypothetical protein
LPLVVAFLCQRRFFSPPSRFLAVAAVSPPRGIPFALPLFFPFCFSLLTRADNMADNEDCGRKHFLVLSTFNEEQQQEGQPALLIPGTLFRTME